MKMTTTQRVSRICSLAYFTSYIMRLGFAAGIVEMTSILNVAQSTLALACTGLLITYGAGQFLSGWLGDRIAPRKLIAFGLAGAALCNFALAMTAHVGAMIGIWCVNGVFQAMLWPPMVRLMAETLDETGYAKASRSVSVAANLATIGVYALMSLFVRAKNWRGYFFMAAALGVVVAAVFLSATQKLQPCPRAQKDPDARETGARRPLGSLMLASGLPLIMLAIVMQGVLRDGVTTWMPSFIADTAALGASASILSTAVLPIFSVLCINIAAQIQQRVSNDTLSSLWLFGVSALCALVMLPLMDSAVACIVCMAVITGCAHAINFLLICHVPSYFAPYGCVSSVSGLINSCTYIGAAASTYGIALISDAFGWPVTVALWCGIAVAGAALCFAVCARWGRFIDNRPQ